MDATAALRLVVLTNVVDYIECVCCRFFSFIMRPSSLGGGRILRRTLSVRLSVCLSVRPSRYRCHSNIGHVFRQPCGRAVSFVLFSCQGCTFRHGLRAAYRTAISAAQILVLLHY